MSEPYTAEIRAFGFTFAPRNWATCNGQIMAIQQNPALFALLGTTFGGNGSTNFGLPNLGGSAPVHWGQGPGLTDRVIGEVGGEANVTLDTSEIPIHNHQVQAGGSTLAADKTGAPGPTAWPGPSTPANAYIANGTPNTSFSPRMIGPNAGNQSHPNSQPSLVVNFCICLAGIYPARN